MTPVDIPQIDQPGPDMQPRIVRFVGEAVNPVGKMLRQAARQKRVFRLVCARQPEQDSA